MANEDDNRYKIYLSQQSPYNPGALKQGIDNNTGKNTSFYNKALLMLKMTQGEFEDFHRYKTRQASTASYYSDSPGVETPRTMASCHDSVVEVGNPSTDDYLGLGSRQNLFAGYNPGDMTAQGLPNLHGGYRTRQDAVHGNYYQSLETGRLNDSYQGLTAPNLANHYQAETGQGSDVGNQKDQLGTGWIDPHYGVKTDQAGLVGQFQEANIVRGSSAYFPIVQYGAGQASDAGDQQEVKTGQGSVAGKFSELEAGAAALEIPNSAFGSPQKRVPTLGLPAGLRADLWPKALEDFLMAWKKANYTFPEISAKMLEVFGVERSANVLSKRYRMILERDAEDNGMMRLLKGATPKLLRVLEEEMENMDPVMSQELRREVWEELQRKLPKVVRTLALQTRMGA